MTILRVLFGESFTIGTVGSKHFWELKTSIGDNFTPKWSWELMFSGSEVLMSTTKYYNVKV